MLTGASLAQASEALTPGDSNSFGLGEIIVTAPRTAGIEIGSTTLSSEAIYAFNRNTLDDAVTLIPGVTASNSGGSRNERLIFVRGFDRFQVPLSIDGIRVYLPADNRLDYGRFLTADVAEIQVAKGYVSVLDGPGGVGGAVNLVTRKPTETFETEGRATLNFDRDASYAGNNLFGLVGTRQEKWYAQVSVASNNVDFTTLSGRFEPTLNENGDRRELSGSSDWRVNAKIAFTRNDTDEYSLSYTRQEGEKNAPLHTTDPIRQQRNWTWPYWNLDSLYFLSTTQLDDRGVLKARLYYNTFSNLLSAFDDRDQDSQALPRAFNSYYEDEAYGGSLQLDFAISDADTLRLAGHYRRDTHVEFQQVFPSGFTEPPQTNVEDTYSFAIENTLAINPVLSLIAGFSYDWRDLSRAEEYAVPPEGGPARLFSYPLRNGDAWNAQGQLVWTPDAETRVYASISSRARFPTIFERFSSRFGGAVSNPDLNAERATNYEIGGTRQFGVARVEAALFYSQLSDVIVAFPFIFQNQSVTQSRNIGSGRYYGAEVNLSAQVARTLLLGGNYTWIERDLDDPTNTAFQPTGVPTHKAFVYADWAPVERLHIVPNLDIASDRWTVNTAGTRYFRTGSYVMMNFRIDYELRQGLTVGIGGRNMFDADYQLVDGFPEPGRSLFLSLRAQY